MSRQVPLKEKLVVASLFQVLPLENEMQTPQDFVGFNGVPNTGMMVVLCLYTAIGFFGYLKYGSGVKGSITLNFPPSPYVTLFRWCSGAALWAVNRIFRTMVRTRCIVHKGQFWLERKSFLDSLHSVCGPQGPNSAEKSVFL